MGDRDQPHLEELKQGCERGYSEGKNIILEYHMPRGRYDKLADLTRVCRRENRHDRDHLVDQRAGDTQRRKQFQSP